MKIVRTISIVAALIVLCMLVRFLFFGPAPVVVTTSPAHLELGLPKDREKDTAHYTGPIITLVLYQKERIYYYDGAVPVTGRTISYAGLRRMLQAKRKSADSISFTVVIKPCADASYKNTVDALDEMLINDIKKYRVAEPTQQDIELVNNITTKTI